MFGYHIGVDIGGTFTDAVAIDEGGRLFRAKAPTTPADYTAGILAALGSLAEEAGTPLDELLGSTRLFVNGTTIVTNAVAELSGLRVGVLTTRGFRDTLRIARSARTNDPDLQTQTPPPDIVRRDDIVEIDERVDSFGEVVVALDEGQVRAALRFLVDEQGCEALAVCFLWSFLCPAHEERVAQIAAELYPGVFCSISSGVFPVAREYERMVTTVFNSYVSAGAGDYVGRLSDELRRRGLGCDVSMMQSIGGMLSPAEAAQRPMQLINSGPVGGALGAQALAAVIGVDDVLTTDLGGTSFDTAVIKDGRLTLAHRARLGDFDTGLSMVDIAAIGAGGGSICWVDSRGAPRVGPRSAGADPGPACYGRGGTEPTVTDVAVALGLIDPDYFLGGTMRLDPTAAEAALTNGIAGPLGVDVDTACIGLYRIVADTMANAVRSATVEKGYDPRRFTVVSFGGAGGLFITEICRMMGIGEIVIPDDAAVFSAAGLLWSDAVRSFVRTVNWIIPAAPLGPLNAVLDELGAQARAALVAQGFDEDDVEVRFEGDMKWAGQIFEIAIPLPAGKLSEDDRAVVTGRFLEAYERLYGKGTAWEGFPAVMLNARATATGRVTKPTRRVHPLEADGVEAALASEREVLLPDAGVRKLVPIYRGAKLRAGMALAGPAVVEDVDTTVWVPPGAGLRVDEYRNYRVTV
ncbi:MAG TPA: hydantoinase/oxoprolinase family protein [Acidimicrobiia bacterium]|nr:hydantoinase/oxoprolinase family protein [Acidimicrobiia bacterium]